MSLDLGDLRGRVAVVTGANAGIGFETALALATSGAHVVLAGRQRAALDEACAKIVAASPRASLSSGVLNLAELASVRAFATDVSRAHPAIDLLINNAGVMAIPERRLTADGFELTFGTNHLGHFALTGLLLANILSAPAPRVVTVSAVVARRGEIDFDNLDAHAGYAPMKAYAMSKLANVAFAVELAARASATRLSSVSVHPGTAMTGLQQHASGFVQAIAKCLLEPVVGHTPAEAAAPSLFAATNTSVKTGGFYGPTGRFELRGAPGPVEVPKSATDKGLTARLWEVSEQLTGVRYGFDQGRVS